MKRVITSLLLCAVTVLSTNALSPQAEAGMRRVRHPYPGNGTAPAMEQAIRANFPVGLQRQALNVAWCESRGIAHARNGQYRGHFQIGRKEWSKFGRGGNPFNAHQNAAAAYRYYRVAGWSPWECRP